MDNIISMTVNEFSNILDLAFKIVRDDLIFPTGPRTIEEQISSQIRGQNNTIRSQQDQLSYQTGIIQEQGRRIDDLKDLVSERDTEIERLNKYVKSLELDRF